NYILSISLSPSRLNPSSNVLAVSSQSFNLEVCASSSITRQSLKKALNLSAHSNKYSQSLFGNKSRSTASKSSLNWHKCTASAISLGRSICKVVFFKSTSADNLRSIPQIRT